MLAILHHSRDDFLDGRACAPCGEVRCKAHLAIGHQVRSVHTVQCASVRRWGANSACSAYPIMVLIAGAGSFMFYTGYKFLSSEPDVRFNRADRGTFVRMRTTEGVNWVKGHERLRHAE